MNQNNKEGKNMQRSYTILIGLILLVFILGCGKMYNSLFGELPLSENYALASRGAVCSSKEMNDGDLSTDAVMKGLLATRGAGLDEDLYVGAEVTLKEAKRIDYIKVHIVEKTLDRCQVKAYDEENDDWKLVAEKKKIVSPEFTITIPRGGVVTTKIRIQKKRVVKTAGGGAAGGGGRAGGGGWFLDPDPRVKEIELYSILKEEEKPPEGE